MSHTLSNWLPTTKKELEIRGWEQADVILFSGDAYVDHPSFGAAVIGRVLESEGLRTAIVPQPDWRGDFRDFKKLNRPRLFFAVSAGCMDSMVNRYTANKRLRSDDAYTPDGRPGARPDYTTITYCKILKHLYPDVPIVIGGIEASMRRLAHYDYWSDSLKPGILSDSHADLLVYGMGETPIREIARRAQAGEDVAQMRDIPQTVYLRPKNEKNAGKAIYLHSYEDCLKSKRKQAENFRIFEENSNKIEADTLIQAVGAMETVVNPPYPPMSEQALDASFDLPYTRLPHPKYKGKSIPAYEMIKFSINLHRGCFGGCAFCAISAHQGKHVVSRSKASILKEAGQICRQEDFKGYLSDLGGPSANMYRMGGRHPKACQKCKRPSCLYPEICPNLNTDHQPLLDIYRSVDALPGVKKSFVGSGIRYDMLLDSSAEKYAKELIFNHVSGRLKVAPEHTQSRVLQCMRKPDFEQFVRFKKNFERIEDERLRSMESSFSDKAGPTKKGRQELIPYFISSHPACTEEDMAELAVKTKQMNFHLEQIQDFTPTPMTLSTEMYYTGLDPYTLKPVHTAKSQEEKLRQRQFFFWYKAEARNAIRQRLRALGRSDLEQRLFAPFQRKNGNSKTGIK